MLQQLFEKFENQDEVPIEVADVASALVEIGLQDSIIFSDRTLTRVGYWNVLLEYTTSPGVYCAPELVTLIVYSKNVSLGWQTRMFKELIHMCDHSVEKTNSEQEVSDLLDKLLGPLSSEDYGLADMMAAVDKMAMYQALGLLFPLPARSTAIELIADHKKTIDEVADDVCLPVNFVKLVLVDDWPEMLNSLSV